MSKESSNTVQNAIKNKRPPKQTDPDRIQTGCTLLDLVVGGGEGLGFPPGKIVNVVGDKSSGKTFLACEIIAANFHQYKARLKFNYDDGESGFTFDTKSLYGIEIVNKQSRQSRTVEDFDVNAARFVNSIKPDELGIYVLDSLDGISNEDIEERAAKRLRAADTGKEFKEGTYGMKTPKFLSQEFFRTKTSQFAKNHSSLFIISQVRENIDPMSFKKWTRSGGKALDFYAHTCLWLATVSKIVKKGRTVGVVVKAKTDKSKTARPFRECVFSLYFDYGIDNIGSNLDYLFDLRGKDGDLKKAADSVPWGEKPVSRDELIRNIETDITMEKELERRVIEKWEAAESEIRTDRRKKYT